MDNRLGSGLAPPPGRPMAAANSQPWGLTLFHFLPPLSNFPHPSHPPKSAVAVNTMDASASLQTSASSASPCICRYTHVTMARLFTQPSTFTTSGENVSKPPSLFAFSRNMNLVCDLSSVGCWPPKCHTANLLQHSQPLWAG